MSTNPIIIVALIDAIIRLGEAALDRLYRKPQTPTGEPDPDQSKPVRTWEVLEGLYQDADIEVSAVLDASSAGDADQASGAMLALTRPTNSVTVAVGTAVAGAVAMPEPAARRVLAALREAHEAGELA